MPSRQKDLPPPFDQGVFLVHYNRGRQAFQEGRYAEARRELEAGQRLRPDDSDVLNLLGLVYFKTGAFSEAEVIYRRLVEENGDIFILHSNLGLILFKQGNLDESERFLVRAIELRPNYAKSHLYLGLLYKQRKKYEAALEHLRFAGADKVIRELETELGVKAQLPAPPVAPAPPARTDHDTRPAGARNAAGEKSTVPGLVPVPDHRGTTQKFPVVIPPDPSAVAVPPSGTAEPPAMTAASKLQDAVDDTIHPEQKVIDLGPRIEGASKTFTLHENGFLEINFDRSVHVKKGTVSSYSGNLKFVAETGLVGTTAQTLIRAAGQGRLFLYEKDRKSFLLDLNDEFIYVAGANLLALEDTLSYRVETIYDVTYQKRIDTLKIFGRGSLAMSTIIEPLTLRVTQDYPLSISSNALVAWTGNLVPTLVDDSGLETVMIEAASHSFNIRFEGDGVVVSEQ